MTLFFLSIQNEENPLSFLVYMNTLITSLWKTPNNTLKSDENSHIYQTIPLTTGVHLVKTWLNRCNMLKYPKYYIKAKGLTDRPLRQGM